MRVNATQVIIGIKGEDVTGTLVVTNSCSLIEFKTSSRFTNSTECNQICREYFFSSIKKMICKFECTEFRWKAEEICYDHEVVCMSCAETCD